MGSLAHSQNKDWVTTKEELAGWVLAPLRRDAGLQQPESEDKGLL